MWHLIRQDYSWKIDAVNTRSSGSLLTHNEAIMVFESADVKIIGQIRNRVFFRKFSNLNNLDRIG